MRSDEIVGDRANAVDLIEKDGVVITIERGAGLRQDRGVFFDAEMFRRVFGRRTGPDGFTGTTPIEIEPLRQNAQD